MLKYSGFSHFGRECVGSEIGGTRARGKSEKENPGERRSRRSRYPHGRYPLWAPPCPRITGRITLQQQAMLTPSSSLPPLTTWI